MRLAVSGKIGDQFLAYAKQVGATDFIGGGSEMPTDYGYYRFQDLMLMRQRIEDAGLRWAVLDGMPAEWKHKIKLGLPGRDEQIANWCRTLENMGAAGVPALGYFFSLRSGIGHYGLRTSRSTPGRGGAIVTSFDQELIEGADQGFWDPPVDRSLEVTEDDVWAAATHFLEAVVPVAEEAGVRMGMHPDDPPMSPIGGVARVFRSHEALRRLIELVPSPSNCVGFCQGTISEMPGDVYDAIRYFGGRDRICLRPLQERDREGAQLLGDFHRRGLRRHAEGDADVQGGRLRRAVHRRPRAGHGRRRPVAVPLARLRNGVHARAWSRQPTPIRRGFRPGRCLHDPPFR